MLPETASANPIDWAGSEIGGVISGVAGDGVRAVTQWAADGAAWLVMRCFDAMSQTTDPRVSSAWFAESYARMTLIAVGLSAPCFLLGLLQALIHRDGAILGRVVLALPLSAFLTGGAVVVTQLLLGATDEASRWLVAASGRDLTGFGTTFAKAFVVAPGASLFVVFLVSLFAAVCALVLWIELLIRAALVYVLLGFFPLVASAMVWPAAAAGVRRVVRLLVAVILSKLVAVGVVCMGVAAVSSDGSAESQFQGPPGGVRDDRPGLPLPDGGASALAAAGGERAGARQRQPRRRQPRRHAGTGHARRGPACAYRAHRRTRRRRGRRVPVLLAGCASLGGDPHDPGA